MSTFTPLETSRLRLRRFRDEDAPLLQAYRNDPEVARYQSWEGMTAVEAEAFIAAQARADLAPGAWLQIALESREDARLVGDLAVCLSADARQAEIGYSLGREAQGRGLVHEALTALIELLFLKLELHRIHASTDPRNTASVRVLERLGFRREGLLKESLWFKGAWVDDLLYALLAREFRAPMGV